MLSVLRSVNHMAVTTNEAGMDQTREIEDDANRYLSVVARAFRTIAKSDIGKTDVFVGDLLGIPSSGRHRGPLLDKY
jgi:hypothetical protein